MCQSSPHTKINSLAASLSPNVGLSSVHLNYKAPPLQRGLKGILNNSSFNWNKPENNKPKRYTELLQFTRGLTILLPPPPNSYYPVASPVVKTAHNWAESAQPFNASVFITL